MLEQLDGGEGIVDEDFDRDWMDSELQQIGEHKPLFSRWL